MSVVKQVYPKSRAPWERHDKILIHGAYPSPLEYLTIGVSDPYRSIKFPKVKTTFISRPVSGKMYFHL